MSPGEIRSCIAVLEALAADRGLLAGLDRGTRRALLVAAGQVARPAPVDKRRLHKALRRADALGVRRRDDERLDATGIRTTQRGPSFVPPPPGAAPTIAQLERPRACYVCKADYRELHAFYDALCPPCAALGWAKRFQTAPMAGRVALVTGARIKIGFQAALMLLRAGARVVATSRFPVDAARRFARAPDFAGFADRLEIHGLDLRHAPSVEVFAGWLGGHLPRLDVIVHNAAQTVRRPPAFYAHMLGAERADVGPEAHRLLRAGAELRGTLARPSDDLIGLLAPAELSQLPSAADAIGGPLAPDGAMDIDAQPVDRRTHNSWRLPLAEVPTPELIEVHLVNAIAPFILTSRLRPLLERDRTDEKHVINVSAMEAQFARRKKTDKHPHTNMAKAALNMMTRTSAKDYAAAGIHMNSVDTGWITDEDPLHHVDRKQRVHGFHPPLDVVDGAARVLDPLFSGLLTGRHPWGKFFKDYREVPW
jgi:NAD(P)-dependent dehydrogenase (short-subunit alcohol dehydrogenase family)